MRSRPTKPRRGDGTKKSAEPKTTKKTRDSKTEEAKKYIVLRNFGSEKVRMCEPCTLAEAKRIYERCKRDGKFHMWMSISPWCAKKGEKHPLEKPEVKEVAKRGAKGVKKIRNAARRGKAGHLKKVRKQKEEKKRPLEKPSIKKAAKRGVKKTRGATGGVKAKRLKKIRKQGRVKKHPPEKPEVKEAAKITAFGEKLAAELETAKATGVEQEARVPEPEAEEPKEGEREIQELPGYARRAAEVTEPRREEELLWLEVRPFLGQQLRVANYLELVNSMYGTGGTFEFIMASGPDPSDIDRAVHPKRVVRYFIKCPDPVSKELAKNTLQTAGFAAEEHSLKFEDGRLLWREPDHWVEYPIEAELELETHYGSNPLFPDVLTYERSFEQFVRVIESLHAALLSGGAFRIAVRRDDKAARHIRVPTVSRNGRAVGGAMSYHLSGFLRGFMSFGRPDGAPREEVRIAQPLDWRTQQEISRRVSQPWFACDARAYGTQDQIRAIEASLGFPSNRFRVFRHRKRSKPVDPSLQELKSALRRGAVLSPLAFPILLWWLGLWHPFDILKNTLSLWPLGFALALPFVIRSIWRMRKTIAMTIGELSLLVSMPSKPEAGHFHFAEGKPRVEIKARVPMQDTSQDTKKEENQESPEE